MNRSHLYKFLLILLVLGWSFYEFLPPKARDLLEVFQEHATSKDAAFTNIVARATELQQGKPGSAFVSLREAVGTNDLTRYFRDIDVKTEKDPNGAILFAIQRAAAGKIRLGLDLQGGTSFLVEMDTEQLFAKDADTNKVSATNIEDRKQAALSHAVEVLRKRVDRLGVAEPLIQEAGKGRILIQLPGLGEADKEQARRTIQRAAYLTIRMVHPDSDRLLAEGTTVWPGYTNMTEIKEAPDGSKRRMSYLVSKKPERGLTGKYIKSAGVFRDQLTNKPEIHFELDSEGAAIFEAVTREYQPKDTPSGKKHYLLAIVLDEELYSAPRIQEPIAGGRVRITGDFTDKEAFELANVLENPLEAPVRIAEERSVDPSLGHDSIRSGVTATIIGGACTFLFMLIFYFFGGLIANLALALNILILMGVMCALGATLTMPGIAGIALTIGMAVDANVLIFERMREELSAGKSLRGVISAGYDKAFGTIFDSNLTTVIAAVILIWMGTGPVQGFGYTLTIGICASMFTALLVTRLIYDFLVHKGLMKNIRMLPVVKLTRVPFMEWSKVAFILTWTMVVVGLGYGLYRGKDTLGVDFAGGDAVKLGFKERVGVDQLRAAIEKLNVGDSLIQYQKSITDSSETLNILTSFDSGRKVEEGLKQAFPNAGFVERGIDKVGPSVGKEITRSAIAASLLALLGILVYVAFRYEFSFAVAAVIALLHDVMFTLGLFCLSGRQFSAPMVAAVLTIIGYSVNDKIVILDRIREDLKLGVRGRFKDLINLALNQTLSRTIITGGAVVLATTALLLFGGGVINDFAFTFLVGTLVGTYSSIFIASPIVLWWNKGERPKLGTQIAMEGAVPEKS